MVKFIMTLQKDLNFLLGFHLEEQTDKTNIYLQIHIGTNWLGAFHFML